MKAIYIILAFLMIFTGNLYSQEDDLMDLLDEEVGETVIYTFATFKSTRIINGQSIERMQSRQLDFRVNHRFGQISTGAYELWGLDNALINFCFEYGATDWLQLGVRRGTEQKTYDGSIKISILRQVESGKVMPVSVSFFSDLAIPTVKIIDKTIDSALIHRLGFTHQLLIARKFSDKLSLQLSPTYVHRNRVNSYEENDIYAIGIGGKFKFHRRVSLMFEYFYTSHALKSEDPYKFYNPLALGFDIETGGHVFQLFLTNSKPMVEKGFISETTGNILDGGIYFGFNISRVFAIPKKGKKSHTNI